MVGLSMGTTDTNIVTIDRKTFGFCRAEFRKGFRLVLSSAPKRLLRAPREPRAGMLSR